MSVGLDNVLEYVRAVEEAVLFKGVEAQVTAFRCAVPLQEPADLRAIHMLL